MLIELVVSGSDKPGVKIDADILPPIGSEIEPTMELRTMLGLGHNYQGSHKVKQVVFTASQRHLQLCPKVIIEDV